MNFQLTILIEIRFMIGSYSLLATHQVNLYLTILIEMKGRQPLSVITINHLLTKRPRLISLIRMSHIWNEKTGVVLNSMAEIHLLLKSGRQSTTYCAANYIRSAGTSR